jgi:hypothetical protein
LVVSVVERVEATRMKGFCPKPRHLGHVGIISSE